MRDRLYRDEHWLEDAGNLAASLGFEDAIEVDHLTDDEVDQVLAIFEDKPEYDTN